MTNKKKYPSLDIEVDDHGAWFIVLHVNKDNRNIDVAGPFWSEEVAHNSYDDVVKTFTNLGN